jgi:hypothetical protein
MSGNRRKNASTHPMIAAIATARPMGGTSQQRDGPLRFSGQWPCTFASHPCWTRRAGVECFFGTHR